MTTRARALLAAGTVALLVVLAGCSSSSSDDGSKRDSKQTTTTSAASPESNGPSEWVQQWDSVLVTDYGPAQEAFLEAVQSAKVVDVQQAILKVRAANEKLGMAIRAAGDAPASDQLAWKKLITGLATEEKLIPQIQRSCIGTDPKCQQFVTMYLDNNKDTIVPALTELRAGT